MQKRFDNQMHTLIQFVLHFPEWNELYSSNSEIESTYNTIWDIWVLSFLVSFPLLPFQSNIYFSQINLLGMTGDDLGRLREYECILQTTRATESHAGEVDDHNIPNGQSNMAEFPAGRLRKGLYKPIHGTLMRDWFGFYCSLMLYDGVCVFLFVFGCLTCCLYQLEV